MNSDINLPVMPVEMLLNLFGEGMRTHYIHIRRNNQIKLNMPVRAGFPRPEPGVTA
jgi:hypothetical protein